MPTFPLLDLDPPHPDGWHDVRSPGGYECWYFDAEDWVNHRQLVAIFCAGNPLHPGYVRADARFRRHPTRVRPALPGDYPCIYFAVYENGRLRKQSITQFPAEQFAAARDRLAVKIGGNTIESDERGIDINLPDIARQKIGGETFSAQLRFQSRILPSIDRLRFLSRTMTDADHYWHLANPICDVTAQLQLDNEAITFRGRGYHDHRYGAVPLGRGIKRWMSGRVLGEDSATVFHHAEPAAANLPSETRLFRIDSRDARESRIVSVPKARELRTLGGLKYSQSIDLGGELRLRAPRVLHASTFSVRLQYAAETSTQSGRAFCEIVYPERVRWPILGRIIERAIDRTRC